MRIGVHQKGAKPGWSLVSHYQQKRPLLTMVVVVVVVGVGDTGGEATHVLRRGQCRRPS